ncbi:hypothetical protein [Halovenus halobia]|uniref:hypothetical protein n=1 Tax=Halovenus halobia TaxID=3396622 RepID=UPI003F55ABC1
MAELLGVDIEHPLVYVAVNVAVWVGIFTLGSFILGDGLADGLIPGLFGGLSFGVFSWYLQTRREN